MPAPPPVLDHRALKDILQQLREQAQTDVPTWKPPATGEDAGTMLQRIFARMLELALLRLNQAPEKNFLAFLDKMGISLLAPSPAKTPLTFSLKPGTGATLVPKGTQAGTQASGQNPAIIFETEDDLTVLPTRLATGFIMDPKWDRFADQNAALAGQSSTGFTPFVGLKRMPHVLYFGDEFLFEVPRNGTFELSFQSQPASLTRSALRTFLKQLTWQYTKDGEIKTLQPTDPFATTLRTAANISSRQLELVNSAGLFAGITLRIGQGAPVEDILLTRIDPGHIVQLAAPLNNAYAAGTPVEASSILRLPNAELIDRTSVRGVSTSVALQQGMPSRWLQAVLTNPLPDDLVAQALQLSQLQLKVSASGLLPDFAFHNTGPLDLTRHFRLFGNEPAVNDAFYIASREALSKPGVRLALEVELKEAPIPFLIWEYWSGNRWTNLLHPIRIDIVQTRSGPRRVIRRDPTLPGDGTESFTKEGPSLITLSRPGDMALQKINEENGYWIRVRIFNGGYRGAPFIKQFSLRGTQTVLIENVRVGDKTIDVKVPNFAATGAILSVGNKNDTKEYARVVAGVFVRTRLPQSTNQISVSPSFRRVHNVGVDDTVEYHGISAPIAKLVQAVKMNDQTFFVNTAEDIETESILLIDDPDPAKREFVRVVKVEHTFITSLGASSAAPVPRLGNNAAINPNVGLRTNFQTGASLLTANLLSSINFADLTPVFFLPFVEVYKITAPTGEPLRFDHPKEVNVHRITDAYFVGYSEDQRLDLANVDPNISTTHFLPFGETPGRTDVFYFGTTGVFPPNIEIDADLEMTSPNVELQWESFGAAGWQPIPNEEIVDGTDDFVKEGSRKIILPALTNLPVEVNGQINYWIRVRILSGNYGLPIEFEPVNPDRSEFGFRIRPGTGNVRPPTIRKLTLSYEAERAPKLITQNGFLLKDETQANITAGGFAPFVSVRNLTPDRFATPDPAFYLGFDAAFPEQPVTLYVAATPRAFSGSVINEARNVPSPASAVSRLIWEYFDGTTWKELPILDGTNNLTESGLVEFLTPTDMAPFAKFELNASRYWIRARSAENDPFDTQQLLGVFPNTIPAIQAVTVQNETIGSSSGEPDQIFRLTKLPVLPGQQVYVREAEPPSDQEREAIKNEEGDDAIQERANSITAEPEVWVRWHEVPSFLRSSPFSRHYTFDHTTGLFKFGDQKFGQIPPRGTNNLIATYRNGGGSAGNVAKGGAAQVKTSVPGIASVTNPVAGDGGAEVETIALVKERGPQVLKHRDRAVTCSDLEWLARQAAGTRVARAYCLPNVNRNLSFEPGWATLIIIPQGAEAKLSPSAELIRQVEDYLEDRAFVGQAQAIPAQINVIGPGYVQVQVLAEVVPEDIDEAEAIKRRVRDRLIAFFHPLIGGPNGAGWAFSRDVYESEVSKIIEEVPGVSHVKKLDLMANVAQRRLLAIAPPPSMDLPEGSAVMTPDRDKAAVLAEPIKEDAGITHIRIKGFKEGDRISKALDLIAQSVSGTTITVQSFNSDAVGFPRGSLVTSFDGVKRTQLTEAILRNRTGLRQIVVEAGLFEAGEVLTVFYPFPITVTAVKVDLRTARQALEIQPYEPEAAFPPGSLLATLDNRVRMPLAANMAANQVITVIQVFDFIAGDEVSVARRDRAFATEVRTIDDVSLVTDVIYLDDNFLPYSGAHQITMVGS